MGRVFWERGGEECSTFPAAKVHFRICFLQGHSKPTVICLHFQTSLDSRKVRRPGREGGGGLFHLLFLEVVQACSIPVIWVEGIEAFLSCKVIEKASAVGYIPPIVVRLLGYREHACEG